MRLRTWAIGLAACAVAVAFVAAAVARRDSEWVSVYVTAARQLLGGSDIYAPGEPYRYPPFAALLAIPFAALAEPAVRAIWSLVSLAAAFVLFRSAWSLAGGGRLSFARPREAAAFGVGLVCAAPYVLNAISHQQTDVVIAALATWGCKATVANRKIVGGVAIGLAAAFKGPPLLFCPYFLFRRQWKLAAIVAGVAVVANLLPDLVSHPSQGAWVVRWLTRYADQAAAFTTPIGTWNADVFNIDNQSLAGTLQRLFHSAPVWTNGAFDFAPRTSPIRASALKAAVYALMLAMAAISGWAAMHGRAVSAPGAAGAGAKPPSSAAIELSLVMVLMLLLSPMSGPAHFGSLAAAAMVIARLALVGRRPVAIAAAGLAVLAGLLANKDLAREQVYDLVLWIGATTWAAMGLWLAGVSALAAAGRAASDRAGARAPLVLDEPAASL